MSASNDLIKYKIRVSKAFSSFVYFTFESNEGLCFYSTLEDSLKQEYRDIIVHVHKSLHEQFQSVLSHLQKKEPIEIINT